MTWPGVGATVRYLGTVNVHGGQILRQRMSGFDRGTHAHPLPASERLRRGCFVVLTVRRRPTPSTPAISRASSRTRPGRPSRTPALKRSTPRRRCPRPTTSDAAGNFQFLSLAPGPYKITAEAQGFRKHEATVTLQTNQTLNVPISLEVGAITEQTTVSATSPLVNTAETRNEMTLGTDSLSTLPLAGHSYISLVTMAPGVSGLGTMGGGQPGGAGGTPGSGVDNYSTETAVDVSANGQGTVANQFIVDGLNVTSGIRQGVLNLTPNPDAIQETSIQVNTFSSEYGGGSSIQMASTTKSGSEQFHGLVSDYYNNQSMFSNTVFMAPGQKYNPFHAQQRLVHGRRPDHSQAAVLLLLRVRAAALLGVDGQPDDLLPGSAVRDVGQAELPQHVRHAAS